MEGAMEEEGGGGLVYRPTAVWGAYLGRARLCACNQSASAGVILPLIQVRIAQIVKIRIVSDFKQTVSDHARASSWAGVNIDIGREGMA